MGQAAQEQVGSWLTDKPDTPLILPDNGTPKEKDNLPVDHSVFTSRKAHMQLDKGRNFHVLKFMPEAGKPALPDHYVLPSLLLEEMERTIAKDPQTVFSITGETLIYRDPSTQKRQPFMVVRLALLESDPVLLPTAASQPANQGRDGHATSQPAPTTQAATEPDEPLSFEAVMRRMLSHAPGRPILPRPDSEEPLEIPASVAPVVRQQLKSSFGSMVWDRVVRIAPEAGGTWYSVKFNSDNTLQDQPMRVLPCALLNKAQQLSKTESGQSVKLVVSGEIVTYKGKQYLLLRKVLKQRNMNQF